MQTTKERMRIEVIGQRLLTGRIAVAQAALVFARELFEQTHEYSSKKRCWAPGGKVALGKIPHIAAVFEEAAWKLDRMDTYMAAVEAKLAESLKRDEIPGPAVVEAIAVGKIASVEIAIDLCFKLKQEGEIPN